MLALPALFLSLSVLLQDPPPAAQAPPTIDEILAMYAKKGIQWQKGPCTGDLGAQAQIEVPEGCFFTNGKGAQLLLESWQNPTSGKELGAVWSLSLAEQRSWHVFFTFRGDGYVKDDERKIDAEALMSNMKEGNAEGNVERKKRGWPTLELVGWQKPPFYDSRTNNLTWATLLRAEKGESVNWSTRMLGREGVMEVDLVINPEDLDASLPGFDALMAGYTFKSGRKYAEFKAGDKIAEYGLAGLIGVGAGALALKTGLFAKLWKLLIIPIAAVGAWLKRIFTGRKKPNEDAPGPSA